MHFFLCGCTAKHPYCILSSLFSFFHCFLQRLLPLLGLGALQKKKHVSYVGLHHCICGITHRWTRLPCVLPKNWLILLTTFLLKLQVMKQQNSVKNKASHLQRGDKSKQVTTSKTKPSSSGRLCSAAILHFLFLVMKATSMNTYTHHCMMG